MPAIDRTGPPDAADWEEGITPAFVARLLRAGVSPHDIEQAVTATVNVRLGESATADDPERRAFCEAMGHRLAESPIGVS